MLRETVFLVAALLATLVAAGPRPMAHLAGDPDFFIPTDVEFEAELATQLEETELRLPGVTVDSNETYLCAAFPLDVERDHFLVGFEALADAAHVHHILLFGCDAPGSEDPVWDCGEMAGHSSGFAHSPVCEANPDILYAWAKNAPQLRLPDGAGFRVGPDTKSRTLVLQVHYMHEERKPDFSGLRVRSTVIPQPKTAATMLVVTGGTVPPRRTVDFEAACVLDEPITIHPFAYRVHTHRHGTQVEAFVVREDARGEDEWELLGRRDPQMPQLFAPIVNASTVIRPGDMIASRCTMKNTENRPVSVGATGADEMCNVYVMYTVEGEQPLRDNTCFSRGYPDYRWVTSAGLNHIPKH